MDLARGLSVSKSDIWKSNGKGVINIWSIETVDFEIELFLNSRSLKYLDRGPNNNILNLSHPMYGRNINEKCFGISETSNIKKNDESQKTFQHMNLVLENCFKWFEHKYTLHLREF